MLPLHVLLALALPASAFAPTDAVKMGIEPQRVRWDHLPEQALLMESEAFRAFRASEGADWMATFDEATGTPRTLWGRGIPVDTTSPDTVAAGVARVLHAHRELFGFELLTVRSARYDAQFDTWYVDFDVPRDGLPTYRGGISARVKHGNLVVLHVATAPRASLVGAYVLTADQAIRGAIDLGPAPTAVHTDVSARPILLERRALHGLELVRTFEVRSRTADPPGIWVTFVDAENGEILNVHNEVRFATGTVKAKHHARGPDGSPLVTSPLDLALVEGDVDFDYTDGTGLFDVTSSNLYTTDLHGDYVDVDNAAGADGLLQDDDTDLLWTTADATQAEIDTYVFLHHVKAWGERAAPTVQWVNMSFTSNVNIASTCNAYWDGNTNFFRAGGGCNNTGENADINYHEWGHGFHYYSILAGIYDGSLGEGAADVVAFLQTGDNVIAPDFQTNGGGIRDVGPDMVYPRDFVANEYYIHYNGLIFGGAMWDLRTELIADLGEEAGIAAAEQIFVGLLKGGTDIPGTYVEAIAADDDDGNLANGTPHLCAIIETFGRHGLGTGSDGGYALVAHEPLVSVTASAPTPVTLSVRSIAADCVAVVPESATLHYRVDGKAWKEVAVDIDGADLTSEIPAQEEGAFVEYWIDGEDTEGEAFSAPFSGKFGPYSYYVGETVEILCETFEEDSAQFRHALLEGEEGDGADDWQWGAPAGLGGDPASAYSGENVWGNDLGLDEFNGIYQPDKVNRLRTKVVETGHYTGVFLQYRRWLNIEDGTFDQAVIVANDQEVWTNWASGDDNAGEHHEDRQWVSHSVDLGGIGDQGELQIGWELHTDQALEKGGWTIDDVCFLAPATPDNRLGIVDFAAVGDGGTAELSWTHPVHAPVSRVVVVRNFTGFPTGWQDGEIVADIPAPLLGEPTERVDVTLDGRAAWYAVYATDGDAWLSWTVEGWNAAYVDGEPYDPATDGKGAGGCGCDSGVGGGGASAWLGVAGLVVLARRRRAVSVAGPFAIV